MSAQIPGLPEGAPLREMKIRITDDTLVALFEQREALGFFSENSIASLVVTAFAHVPPAKVFEALAKVRAYHPATRSKKGGSKT
jgi:hypothetical protein